MKLEQKKGYSVLILKGAQAHHIEKSWEVILRTAYTLSKDSFTLFPLPSELIESVDQILNGIVDSLGTAYSGLRYMPEFENANLNELLKGAKYFLADRRKTHSLAKAWKKPCIYFDKSTKRSVFILKNDESHLEWIENSGFPKSEVVYY